MKLAFVAPASVIHTVKWVNGLCEQGIDVHLITQHPPAEVISDKVHYHLLPVQGGKGYILNALALRRLIKQLKPDIVNVHYASGYGTLARLSGIRPYLLSVWGSDVYEFPFQHPIKKWLIKGNLRAAQSIASTSNAMANQVRLLTPERTDIHITPFGVDLQRFSSTQEPFSTNEIVIGTVKKLEHKYGIDLLIKAFHLLYQKISQSDPTLAKRLRLLIVGDGSRRYELEALADQLKIKTITTFTGAVPNYQVPKLLNQIDLFVVSSRIESFGVAAVEALACSRPCVVTNIGGLPEVVKDQQSGWVVEAESPQALANQFHCVLENREQAIAFGKRGCEQVRTTYSEQSTIDKMLSVLKHD